MTPEAYILENIDAQNRQAKEALMRYKTMPKHERNKMYWQGWKDRGQGIETVIKELLLSDILDRALPRIVIDQQEKIRDLERRNRALAANLKKTRDNLGAYKAVIAEKQGQELQRNPHNSGSGLTYRIKLRRGEHITLSKHAVDILGRLRKKYANLISKDQCESEEKQS